MHARNKCTLLRTANVLLSLYVRHAFFAFLGHLRFLMGMIKVSSLDIDKSLDLEKFSKRNDSDFSLSLART